MNIMNRMNTKMPEYIHVHNVHNGSSAFALIRGYSRFSLASNRRENVATTGGG
jgi:hypothetical protein